jgi:aspartyl-tRNA(Asn)/glutamyl-tRNA(Gln) amidotransferase subunit C
MLISAAMSTVDEAEVEALAGLARLAMGPEERRRHAAALGTILGYLQALSAVDVTDVPEYVGHPEPHNTLAADRPGERLDVEQVLGGAPQTHRGHIAVPKFKET